MLSELHQWQINLNPIVRLCSYTQDTDPRGFHPALKRAVWKGLEIKEENYGTPMAEQCVKRLCERFLVFQIVSSYVLLLSVTFIPAKKAIMVL